MRCGRHPAEAASERVLELSPAALRPHEKLAAIAGFAAIARRSRNRHGDRLHRDRRAYERQSAHERRAEIFAAPELVDRQRPSMLNDLRVEIGVGKDARKKLTPSAGDARSSLIHPERSDQAKSSVRPTASRCAFASNAWPRAMSLVLRPRCQKRIVSSSRSRPGL